MASAAKRRRAQHNRVPRGRLFVAGFLIVASVAACALALHTHEVHLLWASFALSLAWVWMFIRP